MNHVRTGIMIFIIALLLSAAGCTQPSPAPAAPPATLTAPPQTVLVTAAPTSAPTVTVKVVHYILPLKAWKDSELHFAFRAPEDWAVKTRKVNLPEGSQGLVYQTELVPDDRFFIRSYPISLNDDQSYRNTFRTWDPAPAESTVVSNGITFDRFESVKDGMIHVGYVAQKKSASDIGFSNVFVYTADASLPYEKDEFEQVIASFAYFTTKTADQVTSNEIPRVR